MRKRSLSVFLLILILAVTVIPGTYAYMFRKADTIENIFTPANVDCAVVEAFDGTSKTSVKVQNTGNVDAFIRVRIVSYWQNSKGEVVARPSTPVTVNLGDNWIKDEKHPDTYYYKLHIAPDALTGDLLAGGSSIVLSTVEESETIIKDGQEIEVKYTYNQVVEIIAEAIQSLPVGAVESSWNVSIEDGKIQSVN